METNRKTYWLTWAILIVLTCFGFYSIYDRAARTKEIKGAAAQNRLMLNARARIQIILLDASLENRSLNATEIDEIKRLWQTAEYDQTDIETEKK